MIENFYSETLTNLRSHSKVSNNHSNLLAEANLAFSLNHDVVHDLEDEVKATLGEYSEEFH